MSELIIFDCDGVLVDSEPISNRILAEDITAAGWPMTTEDCITLFKGGKLTQVQLEIEKRIGRKLGAGWLSDHYERMFDAFQGEIQAIPGVHEVLETLQERNTAVCVASQGPIRKMKVTLGATGLWPLLVGHIYSADMVARPKPAPDLFLHAAHSEGVRPADCLVVEDSATGIRAAVAAGMRAAGYGAGADGGALVAAGAHTIFSDMAELPALINKFPKGTPI